MAFTPQEQSIIKYGLDSGKSKEDVTKALQTFRAGVVPSKPQESQQKQPGYLDRVTENVGTDLNNRIDRVGGILKRDTGVVEKGTQLLGQGLGLAANTAEQAVFQAPGIKQGVEAFGEGINKLSQTSPIKKIGELIGGNKTLQEVVDLYDNDPNVRDTIDGVTNMFRSYADASAIRDTGAGITKGVKDISNKITSSPAEGAGTAGVAMPKPPVTPGVLEDGLTGSLAKGVAKDILPTSDRLVNFQVSRALDLTQGDIKNINLSTGNEVGQWIADNNLIGPNKAATIKNISDFNDINYKAVRSEINKVKATYNPQDVPRYTEALKAIKQKISGTPGLQDANYEVDSLLKRPDPTLADVQRVKELLDEHFNLYKVTGDVGQGVEKEGLATIRKDIKTWIEEEVKDRTGADISKLNNNVQTSRSISDAIETRSTRGLTRSNLRLGDLGVFAVGSGFGSPLFGGALVLAKKIIESPTFRLRFAQLLDGFSDSTKARVAADLEKGVVPDEVKALQSSEASSESSELNSSKNQVTNPPSNVSNRDIPKTTTKTPNSQGGFVHIPGLGDDSEVLNVDKITGGSGGEVGSVAGDSLSSTEAMRTASGLSKRGMSQAEIEKTLINEGATPDIAKNAAAPYYKTPNAQGGFINPEAIVKSAKAFLKKKPAYGLLKDMAAYTDAFYSKQLDPVFEADVRSEIAKINTKMSGLSSGKLAEQIAAILDEAKFKEIPARGSFMNDQKDYSPTNY